MNPLWSYLAVGFFSFSFGIILGCLIMMKEDKTQDRHPHTDKNTRLHPAESVTNQSSTGR